MFEQSLGVETAVREADQVGAGSGRTVMIDDHLMRKNSKLAQTQARLEKAVLGTERDGVAKPSFVGLRIRIVLAQNNGLEGILERELVAGDRLCHDDQLAVPRGRQGDLERRVVKRAVDEAMPYRGISLLIRVDDQRECGNLTVVVVVDV